MLNNSYVLLYFADKEVSDLRVRTTQTNKRKGTKAREICNPSCSDFQVFPTSFVEVGFFLQVPQRSPQQLCSMGVQLHGGPLPQLRHLGLVARADVYPPGKQDRNLIYIYWEKKTSWNASAVQGHFVSVPRFLHTSTSPGSVNCLGKKTMFSNWEKM